MAAPAAAIDLITDGVPDAVLRRDGEKAVWATLCRVACSYQARGLGYSQYAADCTDPRRHLSAQIQLEHGKRVRTRLKREELLRKAWDSATVWLEGRPVPFSREVVSQLALELADELDAELALGAHGLRATDERLLRHFVAEHRRRGLLRVVGPQAALAESLGLSEKTIRCSLKRLVAAGWLRLAVPGRRAANRAARRANLWTVAIPEATNPIGPSMALVDRGVDPVVVAADDPWLSDLQGATGDLVAMPESA